MEKEKKFTSKKIALTGLFLAVEIILQLLCSIIPGTVNINLSLIPIVLGSIMVGPLAGGFLGLASGVIVLCSPNTMNVFMSINPGATVATCLVKTTVAGLVGGFCFVPFKTKNDLVGSIISSIIVPVLNTLIFAIFCWFCFKDGLVKQGYDIKTFGAIFTVYIGINFLFEIIITACVCPSLYKIIKHVSLNKK